MVMKRIAQFISILFNPLLMMTFLCSLLLFVFHSFPIYNEDYPFILITIVFVFTFVFPALLLLFLFLTKMINSFMLANRKERGIPYVFTSLFYLFTAYLLSNQEIKDELLIAILIYSGSIILLVAFINLFFKISAHALSITSLVGFVFTLTFQNNEWEHIVTLLSLILLSSIVIASRKYLDAHDYFELSSGSIVGLLIGLVAPYFIL